MLDFARTRAVRLRAVARAPAGGLLDSGPPLLIMLNGDPFEVAGPLTVSALLDRLEIDPRRVAVEHNLSVLKRQTFDVTIVQEGDQIEIVNFVGGG